MSFTCAARSVTRALSPLWETETPSLDPELTPEKALGSLSTLAERWARVAMVAADLSLSNKVLFRGVPETCGAEELLKEAPRAV